MTNVFGTIAKTDLNLLPMVPIGNVQTVQTAKTVNRDPDDAIGLNYFSVRDKLYDMRHDVIASKFNSQNFHLQNEEWIDFLDYGVEYDWFSTDDFDWLKYLMPDDGGEEMAHILKDTLEGNRDKKKRNEPERNKQTIFENFDFEQPMKSIITTFFNS